MERRVLVTGSRAWIWRSVVCGALDGQRARLGAGDVLVVVHGAHPRGADALAAQWALSAEGPGCPVRPEPHPAHWGRPDGSRDRGAGIRRNAEMVGLGAAVVLGFVLDDSPGASDCLTRAAAARIPSIVWRTYSPLA